ncbi:hypothetical protein [Ralstonia pseudosolanacearum]|uniref:hypothetical protein n=1 Tax=Ralstonia pseudosolanacearum TaxID=1310165 RepID=UPI0023DC0F4C|nr:hypothetical protein [Ralstonia pseudosolanacearum]
MNGVTPLSSFLGRHGLALPELGRELESRLSLKEGEWLFAAGSLVEGLGNDCSDLDVYIVTADVERVETRSTSQALDLNGVMVDIEVVRRNEIERLASRFERWLTHRDLVSDCFAITERERLLLHRLATSVCLSSHAEELVRIQQVLTVTRLAQHKLDWAVAWIGTLQADLEGLRRVGDWETMMSVALDLLGYSLDALLAAHRKTNPTPKWRFSLLRALAPDWEEGMPGLPTRTTAISAAVTLFCTPTELSPQSVYEWVLSILAFSRRIVPWAEWQLLGLGTPFAALQRRTATRNELPLGHLALGVQLRYRDGRFKIQSVTRCGYCVTVSKELISLLCLFDGTTSRETLRFGDNADEEAKQLDGANALVRLNGFFADPFNDWNSIAATLLDSVVTR